MLPHIHIPIAFMNINHLAAERTLVGSNVSKLVTFVVEKKIHLVVFWPLDINAVAVLTGSSSRLGGKE